MWKRVLSFSVKLGSSGTSENKIQCVGPNDFWSKRNVNTIVVSRLSYPVYIRYEKHHSFQAHVP